MKNKPYWLETKPLTGADSDIKDGSFLVIGSGLSGVSAAYWLHKKGITDITIVDDKPEKAATFRNCGHILHGTVESMKALTALHGRDVAKEIWQFSVDCCDKVRQTVTELAIDCEYRQEGYLVIAIDQAELAEIQESIQIMKDMNFASDFVEQQKLESLGFRNVLGARYEKDSASAHPVKFRNAILDSLTKKGIRYHSNKRVTHVEEEVDHAKVKVDGKTYHFDAIVVATNAYTPFLSEQLRAKQFVEPFRGQIIVSSPLKRRLPVSYPHSFDHGYQYAIGTQDNRLMIGGWRNFVSSKEIGSYKLDRNPEIDEGLKNFVKTHYDLEEEPRWDYGWTGIMATSSTGLPFIGPLGIRTFLCLGYTGHGFSWAHGSAELLSRMILEEDPTGMEVGRFFNPERPYRSGA